MIAWGFVSISAATCAFALRFSASTAFPPSNPRLGYQSDNQSSRSTADIVVACAGTMAVCVITAVHPNVRPEKGWVLLLRKAAFWLLGIMAPECIVGQAIQEYCNVSLDVTFMRNKGYLSWTRKHAFFTLMKGLRSRDGTVVHSGRALYENKEADQLHLSRTNLQTLLDDIEDKSKADVLGKSLAIIQISRFLVGIVTRLVQHLPISPLEWVTCSYVLCALMLYVLWFHKPYDVREPIHLDPSSRYVQGEDAGPAAVTAKRTFVTERECFTPVLWRRSLTIFQIPLLLRLSLCWSPPAFSELVIWHHGI